jgi:hypothetical protein
MDQYISIPSFSLNSIRLSLYNTIVKPLGNNVYEKARLTNLEKNKIWSNLHGGEYTPELRFHNFQISISARKSMIEKINWIYFMARPREKTSTQGKRVFNFRINFLTLTLPSKQVHPTSEITQKCLNQFLTELKQTHDLQNFVWRLEFQKNGNVHYHIVTDVFMDYSKTLKSWNRIISKLGYVQAYKEKHSQMTLNDYIKAYSNNGQTDLITLKKRYSRGRALEWQVPNSVDVKSVLGSKKIAFYISKYFGKKEKSGTDRNELDTQENSKGLRLWFCSRSLSKLKKITDFVPAFKIDLVAIVKQAKDLFVVVHEYCTSLFYSISELPNEVKGTITKLLRTYAEDLQYICAD